MGRRCNRRSLSGGRTNLPLISREGEIPVEEMASVTSLTFSVTSGGAICMAIVGILGNFMVKIQKSDLETNEFAVAERLKREKTATEGEFPEN